MVTQPNTSSPLDYQLWESISVPQPSRFYPWSSTHDSFKTILRNRCLEIQFSMCVDKLYGFTSVKKFVTFGYVVGVSFPWKFQVNFQEF
jgi:hypothetical protein